MFRKFWAITLNDIRLYFSYRSTILFFFVLPVLFMWILNSAFGDADAENEALALPLILVDEDHSALSTFVVENLRRDPTIALQTESDAMRAAQRFEQEEALMLVVIPRGFEAQLQAGEHVVVSYRLASNSTQAAAPQRTVENVFAAAEAAIDTQTTLSTFLRERGVSPSALLPAMLDHMRTPVLTITEERITPAETRLLSGTEQSVLGQIITWGLMTFLGASTVLLSERQHGTLARLLGTPTPSWLVLGGKLFSRYLLGVGQCAILLGTGTFLLGVRWGNVPALMLVVLAFALMGTALGVALATVVRSAPAASGLATLLAMVLSALGGAWWPLEITPPAYQAAARLVPTTWAMRAFSDIVVHGAGIQGILPEISVLVGFATLFLAVGMRTFRHPI